MAQSLFVRARPLILLALVWFVFVCVPDAITNMLDPQGGMSLKMKLVYAVTMGSSCIVWLAAGVALSQLRARSPRAGLAAVILFCLVMAFITYGALGYRIYFDYNPRPVVFAFFLENVLYTIALLTTSTGMLFRVLAIGAPLGLLLSFIMLTRRPIEPPRFHVRIGSLLGAAAVILVCIAFPTKVSSNSPDLIGAKVFVSGGLMWAKGTALPMLPRPQRASAGAAANPSSAKTPNVLLIINESVGRKQVPPWGTQGPKDSETARFLRDHADHSVWYTRATTIAPVTNVAFPSILSGLGPDATYADFKRAPLIWHDAKAAGYATALYSAEDYKYSFFKSFFLGDDKPDDYKTAAELSDVRTVDSGVDDAMPSDAALAFIKSTPKTKPFFVVVQYNGSHFPCWTPGIIGEHVDTFDDVTRKKRCDLSIEYIDRQIGRLLKGIETDGRLEDTLVIHTADHGETFTPTRPKRPINFHEDTLGVPLLVHVPHSLKNADASFLTKLEENRTRLVSNLDIYPTLLELWGRLPASGDRPKLSGQSLLVRSPDDRVLVASARGPIYEPAVQGFALYRGTHWKWLFDEKKGLQLYDIENDPEELVDHAKDAAAERDFFNKEVEAHSAPSFVVHSAQAAR